VKKSIGVYFLGLVVVMFLGSIISLHPADKTESAGVEIEFKCVNIPDQIKERIKSELDSTNPLLLDAIKLLPDLNQDQFELAKMILKNTFSKTYLRTPKFTPERGETIEGWDKILPVFKEKAAKKRGMDIPIIEIIITGEFMAYDRNRKPSLEDDVDLQITIKTVIDLGSRDVVEGSAAHRRLCDLY